MVDEEYSKQCPIQHQTPRGGTKEMELRNKQADTSHHKYPTDHERAHNRHPYLLSLLQRSSNESARLVDLPSSIHFIYFSFILNFVVVHLGHHIMPDSDMLILDLFPTGNDIAITVVTNLGRCTLPLYRKHYVTGI